MISNMISSHGIDWDHFNDKVKSELDHMATFLKMAVAYKKKIGFGAQFTIEPKAREPTAHQYDYDAQTVIGFLYQHGLQNEFKVNIEPNHTTLAGARPKCKLIDLTNSQKNI